MSKFVEVFQLTKGQNRIEVRIELPDGIDVVPARPGLMERLSAIAQDYFAGHDMEYNGIDPPDIMNGPKFKRK